MKGVYQITNKQNDKKYIGSSVDIKKRWQDHRGKLRRGCHVNPHLQNAWNKYGKDAFSFEMLEETSNTLEREQWYLDNVVTWGEDYNIGRDAQSAFKGRKHTEKTRRKLSVANKGKTLSEEHKRKIGEANKGRTLTEEHKRKVSENSVGMLGKKHSEETKRKMSDAQKGKVLTEEHKRKISEAQIGENNNNASLTTEQVWQIHTLYATGNYTQAQLGERFHVSRPYISDIVRGRRWPHVYEKFQRRIENVNDTELVR